MFNETSYNLGDLGMNFTDLVNAAMGAGCSPSSAQTAAAIALAESSGNPSAHNPVPPDDSYGLWQINMLGPLGPSRRSQYGLTSNRDLLDPSVNARAMVAVSGGCSNWRPWSTYTSGAYKKYLTGSSGGGVSIPSGGSSSSSGGGGGSTSGAPPVPEGEYTGMFSGIPMWGIAAVAVVGAYFFLK